MQQIAGYFQVELPAILTQLPAGAAAPLPHLYTDQAWNPAGVIDVDMDEPQIEQPRRTTATTVSRPSERTASSILQEDTILGELEEVCQICEYDLDKNFVEMPGCGKFHQRCFEKWYLKSFLGLLLLL